MRAIHFWVGEECDSAVSGAAALRAAELDSQMTAGAATILVREAQGRESPRFLAYFRQRTITVDSPPPGLEPRTNGAGDRGSLHLVSGTGLPILTELRPLDWSRFSSKHVFIVNVVRESTVFLWLGSNSEPLHKSHALRIIEELKRSRKEETRVFVVEDGYEQTLQPEARKLFDEILDPGQRFVSPDPLTQVRAVDCREYDGNAKNKYIINKLGSSFSEPRTRRGNKAVQMQRADRQVQGGRVEIRAGVRQRPRVLVRVPARPRRGWRLGLGGPRRQRQGAARGCAKRQGLRQEEGLQPELLRRPGPGGPGAHRASGLDPRLAGGPLKAAHAAWELRARVHGRAPAACRRVPAGGRWLWGADTLARR